MCTSSHCASEEMLAAHSAEKGQVDRAASAHGCQTNEAVMWHLCDGVSLVLCVARGAGASVEAVGAVPALPFDRGYLCNQAFCAELRRLQAQNDTEM